MNTAEHGAGVDDDSPAANEDLPHPIAKAIDSALHRFRDIDAVARLVVPATAQIQHGMLESANKVLQDAKSRIPKSSEGESIDDVVAAEFDEAFLALDRLVEANLPQTLLNSLFLGLFSAFDAFTGNLLTAIYKRRPDLVDALNTEIALSEVLKHDSFAELKESVLFDEIEKIRRKSYVDQFEQLEKRFGLNLRKFDNWRVFVEISQRRNLITHCEGVVSKQYLRVCQENEVILDTSVVEGTKLPVTQRYLIDACAIVYEVTLKLGQTLWRKLFDDEHVDANEHLEQPIYEALRIERWDRAIILCHFAASVQDGANDLDRRIRVINHAIALRSSGRPDDCCKLLEREDWSAAARDFKLAVEVLNGRFDSAAQIMRSIGEKGDFVKQKSYHVWPLFREFRRTDHFLNAYQDVYETSYASGLAKEAAKVVEKESDREIAANVDEQVVDEADSVSFPRPPFSVVKQLMG